MILYRAQNYAAWNLVFLFFNLYVSHTILFPSRAISTSGGKGILTKIEALHIRYMLDCVS
jgi:hypothetical protein